MPSVADVLLENQISTLQVLSALVDLLTQTHRDVNGLRASVKGLDPTFEDVFPIARRQADANSELLPVIAKLQKLIDKTLESLQEMQRQMPSS